MQNALLSSVVSSIPTNMDMLNSLSSLMTNYMNQRFTKQMYERTRQDNIEFWNMQNQYNSPAAQMQRFEEAGLNPHLVYGRGESGNAGPIPTPDVVQGPFKEPKFEGARSTDVANALLLNADLRIKSAQADNLEVQNEVIRQDAILRRWQAERAGFDFKFESSLADVSADARREGLRKLKLENDLSLRRDAREAALNASNIQEAAERMLNMIEQRKGMPFERSRTAAETLRAKADTARIRENIKLLEQEGILKKFEIDLRRQGINPQDPMWARYVGMFLSDVADGTVTPSTIAGSIWNWLTR
jgi:hypothetical protein